MVLWSRHQQPKKTTTKNALSSICNPGLIASGQIRSAKLLKVLQEKFLGKGVQTLMNCLSGLSGKTVDPVIKKPQCFRLNFLSTISELENDTDEEFLQNLHQGGNDRL